jgi:hypothetical protein
LLKPASLVACTPYACQALFGQVHGRFTAQAG